MRDVVPFLKGTSEAEGFLILHFLVLSNYFLFILIKINRAEFLRVEMGVC